MNAFTLLDPNEALPIDKIPPYPPYELQKANQGDWTFDLDESKYPILSSKKVLAKKGEIIKLPNLKAKLDWKQNLIHRTVVEQNAFNNPNYQEFQKTLCRSSILYFCNTFCWTKIFSEKISKVPLCTFGFQEDFLTWVLHLLLSQQDGLVEKSRDMGLSWLAQVISAWLTLFYEDKVVYQFSMHEDQVDNRTDESFMGKVRFILRNLPPWLRGGWVEEENGIDNKMMIKIPETKSIIAGMLTGGVAARSNRCHIALYDEFAHIEDSRKVLDASSTLTDTRLFFSSVNGMGNAFADIAHKPGTNKKTYHYKSHPQKGEAWKRLEKSKPVYVDEATWNKEQEIDYTGSKSARVYPKFNSVSLNPFEWSHVQEGEYYEYDPDYDVYIFGDLGMADPTSLVFAQIKPAHVNFKHFVKNSIIIFDEEEHNDRTAIEWANVIKDRGYKIKEFIADLRTGKQRDSMKKSWADYFAAEGFVLKGKYNSEEAPIFLMKNLLNVPGAFCINKKCTHTVMSHQNWSFPVDKSTGKARPGSKPMHNEWSHCCKATLYGVDWLLTEEKKSNMKDPYNQDDWDFTVISGKKNL